MSPYIDPKLLMNSNNLKLDKKSDVYSRREGIILDTPNDYSTLYTECWNNEPRRNKGKDWGVVEQGDYFNNNCIKQSKYFRINLLGYFNYYGIGTIKDEEKAFNLFKSVSEENQILAQYFVGKCYQSGIGTPKNEMQAFLHYEKIAKKDCAMGQFNLAVNNGHLMAMHNLGLLYIRGGDKDYRKAFELCKRSAEEGYLKGITTLEYCYDSGIGINIDKQKAAELYREAANLGKKAA
ncbi:hypothetical protein C1646_769132 [Rhizophagus diaphanus]|nr:hypothetical protein C1646_769132 [Rhizophagus diaphanus] [Rhizophagus sp. MUCL 43196]